MLEVAGDVVQAPNDKQQLEPMLAKIDALPEELGEAGTRLHEAKRSGAKEAGRKSLGGNLKDIFPDEPLRALRRDTRGPLPL